MDVERINRIANILVAVEEKPVLEAVVKASDKVVKESDQLKASLASLDAEVMPENNPLWKGMRKLVAEARKSMEVVIKNSRKVGQNAKQAIKRLEK